MTVTRLLRTVEVAQLLNEPESTVRQRIRRRELPAINVGTARSPRWRVDESDLQAWLDARRQEAWPTQSPQPPG